MPWLRRLKREIGLTQTLATMNVAREQIPALAAVDEKDICHQTNPRPCTRAHFTRFFEQAL